MTKVVQTFKTRSQQISVLPLFLFKFAGWNLILHCTWTKQLSVTFFAKKKGGVTVNFLNYRQNLLMVLKAVKCPFVAYSDHHKITNITKYRDYNVYNILQNNYWSYSFLDARDQSNMWHAIKHSSCDLLFGYACRIWRLQSQCQIPPESPCIFGSPWTPWQGCFQLNFSDNKNGKRAI